jgi:predicted amidohydrolase
MGGGSSADPGAMVGIRERGDCSGGYRQRRARQSAGVSRRPRYAGIYFRPAGEPFVYRKVNLAAHERGRLAAGSALPVADLSLPGGELRAGLQLCREIRYPEQWACLARRGAQVLIYLTYAVNPAQPPGVWRAHLVSRAAETQRFVLAANVAGDQQHCPTMIISPRGEVLAEAPGGDPVVLRHVIDLAEVSDGYARQQRADVVRLSYQGG